MGTGVADDNPSTRKLVRGFININQVFPQKKKKKHVKGFTQKKHKKTLVVWVIGTPLSLWFIKSSWWELDFQMLELWYLRKQRFMVFWNLNRISISMLQEGKREVGLVFYGKIEGQKKKMGETSMKKEGKKIRRSRFSPLSHETCRRCSSSVT